MPAKHETVEVLPFTASLSPGIAILKNKHAMGWRFHRLTQEGINRMHFKNDVFKLASRHFSLRYIVPSDS